MANALLLMCSALVLLESCAEPPPRSVEVLGNTLREVRSLNALPRNLQADLGVGLPGLEGIADRNGRYNPGDVVDSRLPMRRFLVAGLGEDKALVAVEHGGMGGSVEVTLFSLTDGKPVIDRTWTLLEAPKTLLTLAGHLSISK